MDSANRQFTVTFSPPWGTGNRRGYDNDYKLAGQATLQLDSTTLLIAGKRYRFLIPNAPQEIALPLAAVWNVAAEGKAVRFEVQDAGLTKKMKLWAADPDAATALAAALPDRKTDAFKQSLADQQLFTTRLDELSHGSPVTYALVAVNVLVFLYAALRGADFVLPSSESVIALGSNYGPYTLSGQWWRLITSMFLHFGIIHLGMNMLALVITGPLVERLYGSARYLTLYLVAGIIASTTSVAWNPAVNSAGASGAIMGVFGALLAVALRTDTQIPKSILIQKRNAILGYIVYTLVYGVAHRGIDNAAHIGGCVAGFVLGLVMMRPLVREARQHFSPVPYAIAFVLAWSLPELLFKTRPIPTHAQLVSMPSAPQPALSFPQLTEREPELHEIDFDRACATQMVDSSAAAKTAGLALPEPDASVQPTEPSYPETAQRLSEEGRVVVHIEINEHGKVAHANIAHSSGYPELDNAALRYTGLLNYRPATRNGKAVCFAKQMAVKFTLQK